MAQKYRGLYEPEAEPSLVLSHGRAALNEEFRASVWPGNGPAACRKFFADNRKCGSLADVGVGTVDQALLSVLPSRHATLRQFGLSRQVLVLDEVHAYDAYMSREIERLVEFQASHGGSVVLLSATLPQCVKERLASAYCGSAVTLSAGEYPLVTVVSK
jgi:CRISPR-associated endonuclease/helicase Cas3